MKNQFKKITSLLLSISLAFVMLSCQKEFEKPPLNIPSVTFTSNATIAQLKTLYNGALVQITADTIIEGIITSSDETGNIYKSLYIQDATGGIKIAINQTQIFNYYRLGQKVLVKCKGLYIGDYGGALQLGADDGGRIGMIPEKMLSNNLFKVGLPGKVPDPFIIDVTSDLSSKINLLVKIEGVSFPDAGQLYSLPEETTDRLINDAQGNPIDIVVRNSNYAKFRSSLLPAGVGTLVGILSIYNGTYQLYIRDLNDVINFVPDNTTTLINEPFISTLGVFTHYSVNGTAIWHWASYSPNTYALMTGFNGTSSDANEDWLISPPVDMSEYDSAYVTFSHAINKGNVANLQTNHTLWVSKNYNTGDPTLATWEQVTIPTYPAGTNWTFVGSGKAFFNSSYWREPNIHFALKYLCSTSESASWEVKNIKLIGTHK